MHRLNSFKITTLDTPGNPNPRVEINNRELQLVSYHKSHFKTNGSRKMIDSYEVAGYLAPATHKGDGATDMSDTLRVFVFNTLNYEGWETTNRGGMKEAALLRWSQSENTKSRQKHVV